MTHILPILLLIITTSNLWSATVEDIQLSHYNQDARIVFNLSGNIKYDIFTLINPDRLAIDVNNSHQTTKLAISKFTNKLIHDIRYYMWKNTTLRLVPDLNHGIQYSIEACIINQNYCHKLIVNLSHKRPFNMITRKNNAYMIPPIESIISKFPRKISMIKVNNTQIQRNIIIAIDAGHGGIDSGALGKGGTKEKDVVLDIAKRLAQLVNDKLGMKAFLTRDKDELITLRQRIKRAHANGSNMLISIHADSFHNSHVKGASVYVLSKHGASSEAEQFIDDRKNAADLYGNISLEDKDCVKVAISLESVYTANLESSIKIANTVLFELKSISHIHKKHVESAAFVVLKSLDIPSLLVETAFISNADEEQKLKSADYQNKLAHAIMNGIYSYYTDNLLLHIMPIQKYLVQRGDTLISIAKSYQVDLEHIKIKNNLQTTTIKIGDVLLIP